MTSKSTVELQFLQKVKDCQQHLNSMEKLFLNLHKIQSNNEQLDKSFVSLNDTDPSTDENCKSTSSFPDLQLLMREFECKINSINDSSKYEDSVESHSELPLNIQVKLADGEDISSALKLVIHVPSNLIDSLKEKLSDENLSDISSNGSVKRIFKSKRKQKCASLLRRLFGTKKSNEESTINIQMSKNTEVPQFEEKNLENVSCSSQNTKVSNYNQCHSLEKSKVSTNLASTEMNGNSSDSKGSPTLIFPITCNFDEKLSGSVKSGVTIHHQIIPETDTKLYSHSIKVTNEVPVTVGKFENEKASKESVQKELQPAEILLEKLVETIVKTTEKLNSLETMRALFENCSEKEMIRSIEKKLTQEKLENRKSHRCRKNHKIESSRDSVAFNHILQNFMIDVQNKMNTSKFREKDTQQVS